MLQTTRTATGDDEKSAPAVDALSEAIEKVELGPPTQAEKAATAASKGSKKGASARDVAPGVARRRAPDKASQRPAAAAAASSDPPPAAVLPEPEPKASLPESAAVAEDAAKN